MVLNLAAFLYGTAAVTAATAVCGQIQINEEIHGMYVYLYGSMFSDHPFSDPANSYPPERGRFRTKWRSILGLPRMHYEQRQCTYSQPESMAYRPCPSA